MTISITVIRRQRKYALTNKHTDWNKFRAELNRLIDLKVRLKTTEELGAQTQNLVNVIHKVAKNSTPVPKNALTQEFCYPIEIRELIKKRREARRTWHQSRLTADKNLFNRISNQLNRLIKNTNKKETTAYLENFSANADSNYSLWKVTRKFKRPIVRIPPIKDEHGKWMRSDQDKADLFARHLYRVFQMHDTQSNVVPTKAHNCNAKLKLVTPLEIARAIDTHINPRKAPGADEISNKVLKELSKKESCSLSIFSMRVYVSSMFLTVLK